MFNYKEKIGKKYNDLTIIKYIGKEEKRGHIFWCRCECGNTKNIPWRRISQNVTKTCGCNKGKAGKLNKTHGLSHTALYNVWFKMLNRCNNPSNKDYHSYGGRGITVCKEWEVLENFYNWALKNGHKKGLELDREDNNGNYCPENCRWVTHRQQSLNRRTNIHVTINNETKVLIEWAEQFGLCYGTVLYRYYRGDRGENLIRPKGVLVRSKGRKKEIDFAGATQQGEVF